MTGEQRERAVEAALATPVQGSRGRDVVMQARIRAALDAYHRSLREQGVVLVDLREVVTALREERDRTDARWLGGGDPRRLQAPPDVFIKHRFAPDLDDEDHSDDGFQDRRGDDVHAAHNEAVTRCGLRQGNGVVVAGNVAFVTCPTCIDAIERRFGGNERSE